MDEFVDIAVAVGAWSLWGLGHSALASRRFKAMATARYGLAGAGLRRLYNLFALVSLIPVVWVTWLATRSSASVISYEGVFAVLPWAALGLAVVIFIDTLRVYNAREFAGLAEEEGASGLGFSTSHRFVRHPWYFAILLILWVRDLSIADAAISAVLTLYLIIGTRREERRLAADHSVWQSYAQSVPMLVPWPRRYLTTDRLARLISQSD